jgi:hypothetical protein
MVVTEPIRPEVARHLREKEFAFRRAPRASDARGGAHHDWNGSVHEADAQEW